GVRAQGRALRALLDARAPRLRAACEPPIALAPRPGRTLRGARAAREADGRDLPLRAALARRVAARAPARRSARRGAPRARREDPPRRARRRRRRGDLRRAALGRRDDRARGLPAVLPTRQRRRVDRRVRRRRLLAARPRRLLPAPGRVA